MDVDSAHAVAPYAFNISRCASTRSSSGCVRDGRYVQQQVGTWGGCVFDVDEIVETLRAGIAARSEAVS